MAGNLGKYSRHKTLLKYNLLNETQLETQRRMGGPNRSRGGVRALEKGGFWLSANLIHPAKLAGAKWLWGGVLDFKGRGY